uniref:unspecific monooxygenase n=1 Tax=Rousettus aegyptiacus TaxID=9407 RepID=A0A7J8GBJ4_ROUAE|nr:hypothetical protein HJG63_011500 [Rousettus aegyptiacus]
MDPVVVLGLCLSCLLLLSLGNRHGKREPPTWPYASASYGNILQPNLKNISKSFSNLSKVYGPVFTVYFGMEPTMVLHGYPAVKEALVDLGEEFSGRGSVPVFLYNAFPVVFHYFLGRHRKIMENYIYLITYVTKKRREHQAIYDINNPRDFFDCFLIEMEQVER